MYGSLREALQGWRKGAAHALRPARRGRRRGRAGDGAPAPSSRPSRSPPGCAAATRASSPAAPPAGRPWRRRGSRPGPFVPGPPAEALLAPAGLLAVAGVALRAVADRRRGGADVARSRLPVRPLSGVARGRRSYHRGRPCCPSGTSIRPRRRPWVTIALIVINTVIFVVSLGHGADDDGGLLQRAHDPDQRLRPHHAGVRVHAVRARQRLRAARSRRGLRGGDVGGPVRPRARAVASG